MRSRRPARSDSATISRLFELLEMRGAQDMSFGALHAALEAADAFFGAGAAPPETEVEVRLGSCEAVLRAPKKRRPGRLIVYFHGGGFCIGSAKSERGLTLRIAEALESPILVPNYRLAPRHRFPAALEDAKAAVSWAISSDAADLLGGVSACVVGGTSAGANLAVSACTALRDERGDIGEKIPAIFCITGWFDLTNSSRSQAEMAGKDPILSSELTEAFAGAYVPDELRADPRVSPLYARLEGLPPIRVDGAERDTLRDDSSRFAEALERAGVDVESVEWEAMPHMFPYFAEVLEEGRIYIYEELPRWVGEAAPGW